MTATDAFGQQWGRCGLEQFPQVKAFLVFANQLTDPKAWRCKGLPSDTLDAKIYPKQAESPV